MTAGANAVTVRQRRYILNRSPGPHAHRHTPTDNLELPVNLQNMFLDYGRKPESPEKDPYTLHTEKSAGIQTIALSLLGNSANHSPPLIS